MGHGFWMDSEMTHPGTPDVRENRLSARATAFAVRWGFSGGSTWLVGRPQACEADSAFSMAEQHGSLARMDMVGDRFLMRMVRANCMARRSS